jgi:von Willebrand factor type A C-terminal domain/von Willebrand factor type A domain
MTSLPGFSVHIDQNPNLPVGGRDVSAVVTVTAGAADDPPSAQVDADGSAEIIIVDCSQSMKMPGTKIIAARAATSAAVDVIRDGTRFAIIAGARRAWPVYPANGSMAVADERTRAEAKHAAAGLQTKWRPPSAGTAIGQWLRLACQIFQSCPAALRHAILLTDGQNVSEAPAQLAQAIELCEGVFRCDCRGVGTDWNVGELRKISAALLGTVDIVPDPAGLAADFEEMMRGAMSKQLPDVMLRVWMPQQASVAFVKQVAPAIEDLTGRRVSSGAPAGGPHVGDYPTGAWAPGESRDYHVGIRVNAGEPGQVMLAARVSLVSSAPSGQQVLGQGLIRATWTEDEALSARINRGVAHYTGQAELAAAIQEGLEASKRGDERTATALLGRAVALAHQAGNEETARLLARVVDVVDEAAGTVRLRKTVSTEDEMALDTRSVRTVRVRADTGETPGSVRDDGF